MRRILTALLTLTAFALVDDGAGQAVRAQTAARRGAPRTAPAPLPPPPPAFAPSLDRDAVRWVETTLKSLTDDQLVGQLIMGRLDSTYLSADSAGFEELAALVRDIHIGGFCAFGELFRMLSYHDIGPAAMMSRACAGLARGKVVIALPGSEGAVRLAMTKLVVPELRHLVQQASK